MGKLKWYLPAAVRVSKTRVPSSLFAVFWRWMFFSSFFDPVDRQVSSPHPPTSMLSTSSAILPAIADGVFLLEVNAWVRLSISNACDPGSGFFAGIVFSLLLALQRTLHREYFHQQDCFRLIYMSSISSSSERSMRSSLKFWRVTVWSSELSASCASEFKDLGEFWGEFPPCSHSDRSFVLCLKGLKWSLKDLQCLKSSSST